MLLMQNQHTVDALEMHNIGSNVVCRMIDLTFQYGLAPHSALSFALIAQLYVSRRNDVESGFRFAQLSVSLLKRLDAAQLSPRVCLYANMALHWRQPLSFMVDDQIEGYQSGIRNGDINAAVMDITGYGIAYFYAGLHLGPCAADMEKFCFLIYSYGQKMFVLANAPLYQCILNLVGQSPNILYMSSGKA
jgi:predicted ATPase